MIRFHLNGSCSGRKGRNQEALGWRAIDRMVEMRIICKSTRSLTGSRLLLGCLILANLSAGCRLPANAQPRAETALPVAGTLRVVNARHPNGTPIRALQVVATTPLTLPDEFCERGKPLRTFHLVPKDKKYGKKA